MNGDTSVRWSASGNGEKWLALDTGARRTSARWTLVTSTITDGKTDQGLAGLKLQRNDGGNAWNEADRVMLKFIEDVAFAGLVACSRHKSQFTTVQCTDVRLQQGRP